MNDAIQELKTRAEILHHRLESGDPEAVVRLRVLPTYRRASIEALTAAASGMKRQEALTVIAAELGFPNWPTAKAAIEGEEEAADFGTLLYPKKAAGFNNWFKTYEDAAEVHRATGGYLLAYKRQFLIAESYFIESLGLDPADADWDAIGHDWVRPKDKQARARLYAKLIAAMPREVVLST